mgnify:CR=1 FL=1
MKKLRWQLIILLLTGLVVGVLLIAEQPGESLTPFTTAEPEQGGIYTEALVGSLQRLNPLFDQYNSADRDINRLIFSGLVRFDARGLPQPDLAETWGLSEDGLLYNFKLREGIKWHDGADLTAADVLFTVNLLRQESEYIPADLSEFWNSVEVVGEGLDVQFQLPEPFAPFMDYLSVGILPEHLLGALPVEQIVDSPFNLQPVGSGPFRFERAMVENEQVTGIVLRRFDEFYGDVPFLDQIIFRYYSDSAAAMSAYQEGQVQGISYISTDVLERALSEPELALYTGRKPEQAMVFFNLKSQQAEFLSDIIVRKALFMGINRQWIVDRVLNSQAIVADGPVFPGTWAYYEGLKRQEYDPEAARNLLVEAGFLLEEGATVRTSEGVELAFTLLYPDDAIHAAVAEALRKYWADLNAQVDLEAVPYDLLVSERLQARDFDAVLVDMNFTRSPDPDPYPFWDSVQATNGQNYTQWNQKVASEYLEQARVTTDLAERARLYRNFQVIFADELPALPLYYPVYNYGVSEDVQGVRMGPLFDSSDRFSTVTQWHLNAVPAAASVETPEPGQ